MKQSGNTATHPSLLTLSDNSFSRVRFKPLVIIGCKIGKAYRATLKRTAAILGISSLLLLSVYFFLSQLAEHGW
ncbi:hypothetical protein [Desulforhopalus singaporensis]|uniref:Uncharacterized protein n=1 Tax=Desulforhopalus singaporensis TaxID=91360 RepID=A0A1H0V440_9BACT|nr:hypothetical protein [Desulforhopalus singaporensis]SDP73075.1 hypothetical protein SAMN05660330_03861 [Desulforhopalus singaporensis]